MHFGVRIPLQTGILLCRLPRYRVRCQWTLALQLPQNVLSGSFCNIFQQIKPKGLTNQVCADSREQAPRKRTDD